MKLLMSTWGTLGPDFRVRELFCEKMGGKQTSPRSSKKLFGLEVRPTAMKSSMCFIVTQSQLKEKHSSVLLCLRWCFSKSVWVAWLLHVNGHPFRVRSILFPPACFSSPRNMRKVFPNGSVAGTSNNSKCIKATAHDVQSQQRRTERKSNSRSLQSFLHDELFVEINDDEDEKYGKDDKDEVQKRPPCVHLHRVHTAHCCSLFL